jgi:ribosomal protein S18 acetylase RimI-like enzyme
MAIGAATFIVRKATTADVERMLFIWQETNDMLAQHDHRHRSAPDAAECWREQLLGWLQREDIAIFVAESTLIEGKVLGYIIGSIAINPPTVMPERYGYVSELAIDSHAKTGGLGRGMLEALKAWFAERGISHIEARVPSRHAIAQAFWRAVGASELYHQMWLKL